MPGRYVTIYAANPGISDLDGIYMCHVGIFGGKYDRDTVMDTTVTVKRTVKSIITAKKIEGTGISNFLDIKMRFANGTTYDWISLTEDNKYYWISIEAKDSTPLGETTIVLESYNDYSS